MQNQIACFKKGEKPEREKFFKKIHLYAVTKIDTNSLDNVHVLQLLQ